MAGAEREDQGDREPRVRDHLANERTFLAWLRTGIAMLGFGVIVARLSLESGTGPAHGPVSTATLGALFALAGLLTVMVATWQFVAVRRMIERGAYRPAGVWPLIFALLIIGIGVVVLLNLAGTVALPR